MHLVEAEASSVLVNVQILQYRLRYLMQVVSMLAGDACTWLSNYSDC